MGEVDEISRISELRALNAMLMFAAERAKEIEADDLLLAIEAAVKVAKREMKPLKQI